MPCGTCGAWAHNAATCPHEGVRAPFSSVTSKSRRCECCAQYGYEIQRHHTRGRGDDSDYLDVCRDCHLECCHGGDFNNLPIKPRFCRITDNTSYWCR
jgi:hypothetical protein